MRYIARSVSIYFRISFVLFQFSLAARYRSLADIIFRKRDDIGAISSGLPISDNANVISISLKRSEGTPYAQLLAYLAASFLGNLFRSDVRFILTGEEEVREWDGSDCVRSYISPEKIASIPFSRLNCRDYYLPRKYFQ